MPSRYKVGNRMTATILKDVRLQAGAAVADPSPETDLADLAFERFQQEALEQKEGGCNFKVLCVLFSNNCVLG